MKAKTLESLNPDLFHPLSIEQTKRLVGGDGSTNPTYSKTWKAGGVEDNVKDTEVGFKVPVGPGIITPGL